jgi:hypothetical protein
MKIEHKIMEIGSRIVLTADVKMSTCTYKKGHEFTIVAEGERGFDIRDDDGNMICETLLMSDKMKLKK